jgi:RNase H-fold protein (predicted Holliday junction resolvase)
LCFQKYLSTNHEEQVVVGRPVKMAVKLSKQCRAPKLRGYSPSKISKKPIVGVNGPLNSCKQRDVTPKEIKAAHSAPDERSEERVVVGRPVKMAVELNKQCRTPKLHGYSTSKISEKPIVGVNGPLNSCMHREVTPKEIKAAHSAPDERSEEGVVVGRPVKMAVELNKQSRIPKLLRYSTTKIPEKLVVGVKGQLNSSMHKSVTPKEIKAAHSAPDERSEERVVAGRPVKMAVELNKQSRIPKLLRYSTTKIPEKLVVGVKGQLNSSMHKSVTPKEIKAAHSAPDERSEERVVVGRPVKMAVELNKQCRTPKLDGYSTSKISQKLVVGVTGPFNSCMQRDVTPMKFKTANSAPHKMSE